jgi:hypothetical protein
VNLIIEPNLADPDGVYAGIIALHDACGEAEWPRISARLLLILANHIGDEAVLAQAFELAGKRDLA